MYTDDLPMPPWDSVCKAEFWTSSTYVDFRSHLARPRNSFDIGSSEGNVVHLKTVSGSGGSGADATGGESGGIGKSSVYTQYAQRNFNAPIPLI